jgi:hypothetical protein
MGTRFVFCCVRPTTKTKNQPRIDSTFLNFPQALVKDYCSTANAGDRMLSNGDVRCLACKVENYNITLLKRRVDDETFDALLSVREDVRITLAVDKALQQKAEKDSARPSSRKQIEIDFAVKIANQLQTLACGHCGQAFAERESEMDCLAIKCCRCKGVFCGWCTYACSSQDEGHVHVAHCIWKPKHIAHWNATFDEWNMGVRLGLSLNT